MRRSCHAFTLAELLVSIAVLTLLVFIASRMVTSATNVATQGNKRMESDSQVRLVLDRMAVDFSQMIRRTDVDCYAKSNLDPETGNDRIALFSTVTGYYPSTGSPSPISLVAYRINADPTSHL
jgi:prepilin-type N-terminal cleavage/methylation domain-containing protein